MEVKENTRKNRIQEDKDYVSNILSNQSRYIGFTLIFAYFALLNSDKIIVCNMFQISKVWIFLSGSLGFISILFDLLQYISGYISSNNASNSDDLRYSKKWLSYKLRILFFWGKLTTSIVGLLVLITVIIFHTI